MMSSETSSPLAGKTILVTQPVESASRLSDRLRALGATVLNYPAIRFSFDEFVSDVRTALDAIPGLDWMILPSPIAVEAVMRHGVDLKQRQKILGVNGVKIAVMGDGSRRRLKDFGFEVDFVPNVSVSEQLVSELVEAGEVSRKTFIVFRSERARNAMAKLLLENGAVSVQDIIAYRTLDAEPLPDSDARIIAGKRIDAVTFTSASTVDGFFTLMGDSAAMILAKSVAVSIGPKTSRALLDAGYSPASEARRHNVDGLIEALVETIASNRKGRSS